VAGGTSHRVLWVGSKGWVKGSSGRGDRFAQGSAWAQGAMICVQVVRGSKG
jgi:hypothetical protein